MSASLGTHMVLARRSKNKTDGNGRRECEWEGRGCAWCVCVPVGRGCLVVVGGMVPDDGRFGEASRGKPSWQRAVDDPRAKENGDRIRSPWVLRTHCRRRMIPPTGSETHGKGLAVTQVPYLTTTYVVVSLRSQRRSYDYQQTTSKVKIASARQRIPAKESPASQQASPQ